MSRIRTRTLLPPPPRVERKRERESQMKTFQWEWDPLTILQMKVSSTGRKSRKSSGGININIKGNQTQNPIHKLCHPHPQDMMQKKRERGRKSCSSFHQSLDSLVPSPLTQLYSLTFNEGFRRSPFTLIKQEFQSHLRKQRKTPPTRSHPNMNSLTTGEEKRRIVIDENDRAGDTGTGEGEELTKVTSGGSWILDDGIDKWSFWRNKELWVAPLRPPSNGLNSRKLSREMCLTWLMEWNGWSRVDSS